MNDIGILVSPNKHGLVKECSTLRDRLINNNKTARLCSPTSVLSHLIGENRLECLIVYNLSFSNFLIVALIFFLKFFLNAPKVIWQNHEPHGFSHKLRNNSYAYAFSTFVLEIFYKAIVDKIGTPNLKNSREYGYLYLPLQYQLSERADDINSNNSKGFGYLGRIDSTRLFSNEGSLEFYPGKFSKSESGKVTFMKRIVGILNIYTRPHAQSGVTPDALSFRKFVAVCDNDAWADYDWGGYMCVFKGHSESIILSKFQEYVMKAKVDDSIFEATFSECFGKRSINHWICAIES